MSARQSRRQPLVHGVVRSIGAIGELQSQDAFWCLPIDVYKRTLLSSHAEADAYRNDFGERHSLPSHERICADEAKLECCAPHRRIAPDDASRSQSRSNASLPLSVAVPPDINATSFMLLPLPPLPPLPLPPPLPPLFPPLFPPLPLPPLPLSPMPPPVLRIASFRCASLCSRTVASEMACTCPGHSCRHMSTAARASLATQSDRCSTPRVQTFRAASVYSLAFTRTSHA